MHKNRRDWLTMSAVTAAAATAVASALSANSTQAQETPSAAAKRRNGRIRQSVMGWCFKPMPELELAKLGKQLGLVAIEGIDKKFYPDVKKLGLDISLVSSHGFAKGPVDTSNHAAVEQALRESIDTAVEFG